MCVYACVCAYIHSHGYVYVYGIKGYTYIHIYLVREQQCCGLTGLTRWKLAASTSQGVDGVITANQRHRMIGTCQCFHALHHMKPTPTLYGRYYRPGLQIRKPDLRDIKEFHKGYIAKK